MLYTFPFEGNWNKYPSFVARPGLSCYTLSRLKGIETNANTCAGDIRAPCYTLSRLKGIETKLPLQASYLSHLILLYTFPFEGNWNKLPLQASYWGCCLLYTFPFEGNWNPIFPSIASCHLVTCYTLSRLKGIETSSRLLKVSASSALLYTFPFEGNWNCGLSETESDGWCGLLYTFPFEGNWNTTWPFSSTSTSSNLLYTFPFEGNWNLLMWLALWFWTCVSPCYTLSRLKGIETVRQFFRIEILMSLAIHFPVWRELKRKVVNSIQHVLKEKLAIHFPVWRELKRSGWGRARRKFLLLYTFPFEGNWNEIPISKAREPIAVLAIHFPVWRELKQSILNSNNKKLSCLLYTFPFEGNWNVDKRGPSYWPIPLAIHFPVWRELKLRRLYASDCSELVDLLYTFPFEGNWNLHLRVFNSYNGQLLLAIHFPVWRELKQGYHSSCSYLSGSTLLYTFPFEGNWNSF